MVTIRRLKCETSVATPEKGIVRMICKCFLTWRGSMLDAIDTISSRSIECVLVHLRRERKKIEALHRRSTLGEGERQDQESKDRNANVEDRRCKSYRNGWCEIFAWSKSASTAIRLEQHLDVPSERLDRSSVLARWFSFWIQDRRRPRTNVPSECNASRFTKQRKLGTKCPRPSSKVSLVSMIHPCASIRGDSMAHSGFERTNPFLDFSISTIDRTMQFVHPPSMT